MPGKQCQFLSPSLLTGSEDVFRNAVGGYWNIEESVNIEGTTTYELEFIDFYKNDPLSDYFDTMQINTESEFVENISDTVIFPSKRAPVRILASGNIDSDVHWKTILMGGTYGDQIYSGLYNENVFNTHYFTYEKPYPKIEEKLLRTAVDEIQISYEYNNYLPQYQDYIRNASSVLTIPNYYLITDLQSYDLGAGSEDLDLFDEDLLSFVTLENQYEDVDGLFTLNRIALRQIGMDLQSLSSDQRAEKNKSYTYLTTNYLASDLRNNPLSASTETYITHKMKNVFLDSDAIFKLYTNQKAESSYTRRKFPYYMKIDFPLDNDETTSTYRTIIEDADCSSRFLKVLKESFSDQLSKPPHNVKINNVGLKLINEYSEGSTDSDIIRTLSDNEDVSYKAVDFHDMLAFMHNNYLSVTDDCMFIGENNTKRKAAMDTTGAYRFFNSIGSLKTISGVAAALSTLDASNISTDITPLDEAYTDPGSYTETLAYRIEKIGGKATGDSKTQNALQNYWLMNTNELDDFTFIDTQVKYGVDYTYKVYAYVMVVDKKYKFSNLALSRLIGYDNTDATAPYGLEFYNPTTGEDTDQLFNDITIDNEYATEAQIRSRYPFAADFYLEYENSLKIIEVPIYTKTLRILDHPANTTNVYPYQHLNTTQQVGFGLYHDVFSHNPTPVAVTPADSALRTAYMNANDLLEDENIVNESVSRPRYAEIYRIDTQPTSFEDFAGDLIATVDMKIQNYKPPEILFTGQLAPHETYTYTNEFYDEKIKTNKKYYYLFRILNEQRTLAQWSDIYQTELINDGGFIYSLFDTFYESDLEQNAFVEPSKNFKKLIHMQTNLQHLMLDTSLVDFDQRAHSQMSSVLVGDTDTEDLIWNKTFKIRVTSKKTGKKIDLNITYNLNRE